MYDFCSSGSAASVLVHRGTCRLAEPGGTHSSPFFCALQASVFALAHHRCGSACGAALTFLGDLLLQVCCWRARYASSWLLLFCKCSSILVHVVKFGNRVVGILLKINVDVEVKKYKKSVFFANCSTPVLRFFAPGSPGNLRCCTREPRTSRILGPGGSEF